MRAPLGKMLVGLSLLSAAHATAGNEVPQRPVAPSVTMAGVGLRVADLAKAVLFFTDGLGMREIGRFSTAEYDEVILGFADAPAAPPIFLLQRRGGRVQRIPPESERGDKLILTVADIGAISERLGRAGYSPGAIKRDAKSGVQQMWVAAPDGHRFEIVQRPTGR